MYSRVQTVRTILYGSDLEEWTIESTYSCCCCYSQGRLRQQMFHSWLRTNNSLWLENRHNAAPNLNAPIWSVIYRMCAIPTEGRHDIFHALKMWRNEWNQGSLSSNVWTIETRIENISASIRDYLTWRTKVPPNSAQSTEFTQSWTVFAVRRISGLIWVTTARTFTLGGRESLDSCCRLANGLYSFYDFFGSSSLC